MKEIIDFPISFKPEQRKGISRKQFVNIQHAYAVIEREVIGSQSVVPGEEDTLTSLSNYNI